MPANLNLKKSWHPGLLKNQKKIWKQEQDTLQEYQKIKERRKELEAEKEREEFIKLQYGDDLENIPKEKKLQLNKLDWMYDSPSQNSSGFNEMVGEFTEGKQQVENLLSGKQALSDRKTSRFEQVLSVKNSPASKALVADDPLMKINLSLRSKSTTRPSHSSERRRHKSSGREKRDKEGNENRKREKSPERGVDHHQTSSLQRGIKPHRSDSGHRSRNSSHRSRSSGRGNSHGNDKTLNDSQRERDSSKKNERSKQFSTDNKDDVAIKPKMLSYD